MMEMQTVMLSMKNLSISWSDPWKGKESGFSSDYLSNIYYNMYLVHISNLFKFSSDHSSIR